jgi:Flp pilus assembly protein TadD
MVYGVSRLLAGLGLAVVLAGCGQGGVGDLGASGVDKVETGSINPGLTGASAADPVSIGKKQFAEGNFGLAEENFRKAAELGPRDAEAWIGLAASYDRLKRFDLADRAYGQVIRLVGRTAIVLNNQGYSYMLRGDLKTARKLLNEAKAKDPENPSVLANLDLLNESIALAKDVR